MYGGARRNRRLVYGAAGLVLGDFVFGLTASSSIMLGGLWICSLGWLKAWMAYAGSGLAFGSGWQFALACIGAVASLPALAGTIWLARNALRLPASLVRDAIA